MPIYWTYNATKIYCAGLNFPFDNAVKRRLRQLVSRKQNDKNDSASSLFNNFTGTHNSSGISLYYTVRVSRMCIRWWRKMLLSSLIRQQKLVPTTMFSKKKTRVRSRHCCDTTAVIVGLSLQRTSFIYAVLVVKHYSSIKCPWEGPMQI